ncbi:MAG: indole-3-glycerol phosphate synthase TrpC [Candidatus Omnitrophota bacterium]
MTEYADFLKEVVSEKHKAIKETKRHYPEEELRLKLEEPRIWRPFKANISQAGKLNIIAEIKRTSPSQEFLREDFDLLQIARLYQNAGAGAISILTEEKYFSGKIAYLKQARKISELPILRKDFIFEPYQLYESKFFGADAVLLIAELLREGRLSEFLALAKRLELDCLVEVNSLDDLKYALDQGAEIIGLNSRNLHTLEIDKKTADSLIEYIPEDRIVVAESAIKTHRDYLKYQKLKVNALLIGSALMKAEDIKKKFSDIVNGSAVKKVVKKTPAKSGKKSGGKPR